MRRCTMVMMFAMVLAGVLAGTLSAQGNPQQDGFDHGHWAAVLKSFNHDGWVDYAALKRSPIRLDRYLVNLARADMDTLSRGERMALFINAYNAFTLKLITEHYPDIDSIKDISWWSRWRPKRWKVGGTMYSLQGIEHDVLRAQFGDARVHFALVCASIGCPPLMAEPYTGEDLNAQLDANARRYLASEHGLIFPPGSVAIWLSEIFKWFESDFEQGDGSVLDYVGGYVDDATARRIRRQQGALRIRYIDYDWTLNDIRNRPRAE